MQTNKIENLSDRTVTDADQLKNLSKLMEVENYCLGCGQEIKGSMKKHVRDCHESRYVCVCKSTFHDL